MWISEKDVLAQARFGLPKCIWDFARAKKEVHDEFESLCKMTTRIKEAGAEISDAVDFPSAKEIISPDGWDW